MILNRSAIRLSAVVALALVPLHAAAQEKVVNVYNWSDYVGEGVLDDSPRRPASRSSTTSSTNEMLETKLLAGGSGYDIVVPTDSFLARMIQAGVVQKLDKAKIPNLSNHVGRDRRAARHLRSRQRIRHRLHVGHDRHRLQRRQDQGADARRAGRFLGHDLQAGGRRELRRLRRARARFARRHLPAALHYLGLDPDRRTRRSCRRPAS